MESYLVGFTAGVDIVKKFQDEYSYLILSSLFSWIKFVLYSYFLKKLAPGLKPLGIECFRADDSDDVLYWANCQTSFVIVIHELKLQHYNWLK